jgi:hypothetical protein
MTARSPYTLDAVQLEKAVQALQKAAETLRPNLTETRLYRVLGVCLWVAVAALIGVILTVTSGVSEMLIGIFGLLFLLAAGGAPVFLLLNFSVVTQAFRQRRLLKKLGIREVSLSAWRLERQSYRWSRLAGAILTGAGILTFVIGLLVWISRKEGEDVWVFGTVALFFMFGSTVLVWRFVQRSREQLAFVADANRLRSALESVQTKAGAGEVVAIPAAVIEDVARIERVQIARERRDAVVASAKEADRGYGVLVARDLSSQKGLLDPKQRIAVEELIDDLSTNPRPTGAEPAAKNLFSVRTAEGDVEVQYSIDDEARRVQVVALHPAGASPGESSS